jgi:hypothetical protein
MSAANKKATPKSRPRSHLLTRHKNTPNKREFRERIEAILARQREERLVLFGGAADQVLFDKLRIHEMSHCLMLMHAGTAPGARDKEHDPADNICVMSYDPNDGDHCGQRAAALRGVNTRLETKFP